MANNNIKHLFVASSIYPAEIGGPSNTIYQMAKGISSAEVVSSDLGMSQEIKNQHCIIENECNDISGVSVWVFNTKNRHSLSIRLLWWVWRNLDNYNVVHLSSFFAPLSVFCAMICLIKGQAFTVAPRGELYGPALSMKAFKKAMALNLLKALYGRSLFYLAASNDEALQIQAFTKRNIIVSPNSYDFAQFHIENCPKKHFLYIGRLNPIKNLELLISAYRRAKNRNPNLYNLVLAGSGRDEYVESLKSFVRENDLEKNVLFAGHVVGRKKSDLFNGALATLLVSKSENFGNVVVESLAHGVPVIASSGTPWRGLPENGCGLHVEPSSEAIETAILKFFNMDNLAYSQQVQSSFDFAYKNYSSEIVLPNFELKVSAELAQCL